ncbi:MAG: serine/threonine protein kinase [Sphingobacteriaceae bacterium]|jgi:serine/threonine protein kinase
MPIHDLNKDFLATFKITGFFKEGKRGGQKAVHFVEAEGTKYAMKLLLASGIDERTKRELDIYNKFKGLDGIPTIYKIESYEGELVVFEEFVEGNCLGDIIGEFKGDSDRINTLIKALCKIMKPIWDGNYIHRDIKPANIMIRGDGTPVLLDFGIARDLLDASITATGLQPLSWQYGAPEQYAGKKDMISYRTDFFSMGVLAYVLYHQHLPFGNSKEQVEAKFQSGDETFKMDPNFKLKDFCTASMRFSAAERPRKLEDLIKLLP